MNLRSLVRVTLGFALVAALAGPTRAMAPLSFQGVKPASVKPSADVDPLVKQLATATKGKADKDMLGVAAIEKLGALYEKVPPKQQKAIVKSISSCFRARRKPDQVTMWLSAAQALSGFGDAGADALGKVAADRRFRNKKDWKTFRAQVIALYGKPAAKKHQKSLIDIALKDNDDRARAKAGEALGHYAIHDQKARKEIVKRLVKSLEEVYAKSKANIDANDLERRVWEERYAAISDPWMKTLTKHTGQPFRQVQDWTQWYNKNKRKNWDKSGFRGVKVPKKKTK